MNEDLLSKLQTDENFRIENQKNIQRYKSLQQAASYSQIHMVPQIILRKVPDKEIYLYFGYLQPTLKKDMGQVAMYLIKNFKPNTKRPYTFVFFNDKCQDNYVLWNFRQTFSYLKIQQISALQQFIVVKPYFYHKTMDWMTFGVIPKYIRSRTKFIYSYKQLYTHLKCGQNLLIENVPGNLYKDELPNVYALTLSLSMFRMNIQGQQRSQQETMQLMQFHKSIKSMVIKPGYEVNNLQDYDLSGQGIPNILKMLIFYFDTHKEGLRLEGILRKSVSIDQQNQTIMQILSKNFDYLLQVQNPHIIANLIKRFFSSLKTPVFPFDKFQKLMNDQGVTNKTEHLKKVFDELPELNKRTLIFMFTFLKDKIITNQAYNKMSVHNVGVCIAPCLFRSQKPSLADLMFASKGVVYCKLLITEFQKIFGSQQERQQLYRKSYLESKVDFDRELGQQIIKMGLQAQFRESKINVLECNRRTSQKYDNQIQENPIQNYKQETENIEGNESKKQQNQIKICVNDNINKQAGVDQLDINMFGNQNQIRQDQYLPVGNNNEELQTNHRNSRSFQRNSCNFENQKFQRNSYNFQNQKESLEFGEQNKAAEQNNAKQNQAWMWQNGQTQQIQLCQPKDAWLSWGDQQNIKKNIQQKQPQPQINKNIVVQIDKDNQKQDNNKQDNNQ